MKNLILTAVCALALAPLTFGLSAHAQSYSAGTPVTGANAINYWALMNTNYTYSDLMIAKTRDYSDRTIARLVKISEETQVPFCTLSDAFYDGKTFTMLCDYYNVPLTDLNHVQKQEDEVANYLSAYETTGMYAFPDVAPASAHGYAP